MDKEYNHLPDWKHSEIEEDTTWVHNNLSQLIKYSQERYYDIGRGVIMVFDDRTVRLDGKLYGYFAGDVALEHMYWDVLEKTLETYDPSSEVIIIFFKRMNEVNIYLEQCD